MHKITRQRDSVFSASELKQYENSGWGLSQRCFADVQLLLARFDSLVIVEFGSGHSTSFLLDYLGKKGVQGRIHSYDHDKEYATKRIDSRLSLKICELESCDDEHFHQMFEHGHFIPNKMRPMQRPVDFFSKNTFYAIRKEDLPEKIDFLLVDGHHGNGRSIAFLHAKAKLRTGSIVLIDDFIDFDFTERFFQLFPKSTILKTTVGFNDRYRIVEVIV